MGFSFVETPRSVMLVGRGRIFFLFSLFLALVDPMEFSQQNSFSILAIPRGV